MKKTKKTPVCSQDPTKAMFRATRPYTFVYKGEEATVDMSGWYCDCGVCDGIFSGTDLREHNETFKELRNRLG